jgi:hypothetical protein
MRNLFLIILIGSFLLASCASPSAPTATLTVSAPIATATQIPTATPVPPTPTSEPTPTSAPVAVPLIYKGWTDKAYSRTCVDAVITMTMVDLGSQIIPAASSLLEAMGLQVVPRGADCEAMYVFVLAMEGTSDTYSGNGQTCDAFTGAELYGDLVLMTQPNNQDGFSIPLRGTRETSQATSGCKTAAEAPFGELWPKAVVEGFSKIYGFKALEAALTVPALQFEVASVLQEGKFSAADTMPVLMKALQDADPNIQKAALVSIAGYKAEAAPAVPLLIPFLTNSDKYLASLAADDLRMIGPGAEAAIPALLVAIEDPDVQLAPQAAFALGTIGKPEEAVLTALIRHANDANASMKMFVQTSLQRLTGEKFTTPGQWLQWWSSRPTPLP